MSEEKKSLIDRLLDNPKPAQIGVVLFVIALLVFFAIISRADAHENPSELRFEAGATVLRGETPALGLNLKWPEAGPVNTDFEFGFHLIGSSHHYRSNPNAFTLYGQIVDGYKWFEIGFGFAYTNVETEYTCQKTANLMAGAKHERWTLRWYHNSSAGSCDPNAGRDLWQVGWRF